LAFSFQPAVLLSTSGTPFPPTTLKQKILEPILFPPASVNKKRLYSKIQDQTILITGASFGIGEELACLLAPSGAKLVLVARTKEKLERVADTVRSLGGQAHVFALDLCDETAVSTFLNDLRQAGIQPRIFVNNAGKSIRRSVFKSLDRHHDFTRTMQLNYFAPVQIMLDLIPMMAQSWGQIINVSSLAVALLPAPGWAAYLASKSAFDQWLRSVSPELESKNIKSSSLYFPLVRTRMIEPTRSYRNTPAMSPENAARWIANAILYEGKRYYPWWSWILIVSGNILRPLWEAILSFRMKRKPFR